MEKKCRVVLCHCGKVVYAADEKLAQTDTVIISELHNYMREKLRVRTKDAQFVRDNFSDHKAKDCKKKKTEVTDSNNNNQLNLF